MLAAWIGIPAAPRLGCDDPSETLCCTGLRAPLVGADTTRQQTSGAVRDHPTAHWQASASSSARCSGPAALTTHLADLGADVIKVEPPQGDYGRQMTWPIVEGVSLLFLHISRGKRSIVLDLRTDEGREAFLELVARRRRGRRGHAARAASTAAASASTSCARSTRRSCSARSRATA